MKADHHHVHHAHKHDGGTPASASSKVDAGRGNTVTAAGSTHTAHEAHGGHDHAAMVADFRRRFWVTLLLTPPILLLSPMIQHWLGISGLLSFRGSSYVLFALSTIAYVYGGWPFLTGFTSELRNRQPGMMTLIALAISAAYFFSAAVTFGILLGTSDADRDHAARSLDRDAFHHGRFTRLGRTRSAAAR